MKHVYSLFLTLLLPAILLAQEETPALYMERLAALERFNGAWLLQDQEGTIHSGHHGYADAAGTLPIDGQTAFDIGSLTKQFVAAAILHMAEQNKLLLRAPINEYLGQYASEEWEDVTIHHLLTHQSGIPSIMQGGQGLDDFWPQEQPTDWSSLLSHFAELEVLFDPGDECNYSNSGYVLLALILEVQSGKSFGRYMEEDLFRANGLHHTTIGRPATAPFAQNCYGYAATDVKAAPAFHHTWYQGAGGAYSTLSDLHKWLDLLQSGKFLNSKSLDLLWTKHAGMGYGRSYGYGWVLDSYEGESIWYHDGTNMGAAAFILAVPGTGERIILLSNRSYAQKEQLGASAEHIENTAFDLLGLNRGKRTDLPPATGTGILTDISYSGHWLIKDDNYHFTIQQQNEQWVADTRGSGHALYRHATYSEVSEDSHPFAASAINAAAHLANRSFWKFASYCTGEMKFVSYSGLLSIGYRPIVKGLGEINKTVVYGFGRQHAKVRFFGEHGMVDFALVYDEDYEIDGVFDTGYPSPLAGAQHRIIPLNDGRLLVDGFSLNEPDVILELIKNKNELLMTTEGRSFVATRFD